MNLQKLPFAHASPDGLADLTLMSMRMLVQVEGTSGEKVIAAIYPLCLEPDFVSASIEWEGVELWASIVRADVSEPEESRLLLLVSVAVGDEASKAVPTLGRGRWRSAELTLPLAPGQPGAGVTVSVDAETWQATLIRRDSDVVKELLVPPSCRMQDAGRALAEMSAHFLLGRRPAFLDLPPFSDSCA